MLHRLMVVVAAVVLVTLSTQAQEPISLNFEVLKAGSLVARPSVSVNDGETGSLSFDGGPTIRFTPRRVATDKVSVAFEIERGGKTVKPRLILLNQEQGTLSFAAQDGATPFELRVKIAAKP
jgi:hypothetical protein